jgi:hypothetical protein
LRELGQLCYTSQPGVCSPLQQLTWKGEPIGPKEREEILAELFDEVKPVIDSVRKPAIEERINRGLDEQPMPVYADFKISQEQTHKDARPLEGEFSSSRSKIWTYLIRCLVHFAIAAEQFQQKQKQNRRGDEGLQA